MQAWDKFFKVKHAQSKEVHELLNKLLQDLQSINEELAEYINTLSWNLPTSSYDDDDDEYSFATQEYLMTCSTAITPDSPKTDSLIMVDKHLNTILEMESDEFIKSSVENLIDSLLDEFSGELITIPPRIVREHKEYISMMERLLYDNSSPRLSKDFHANPNTIIESLPTFPILIKDSNSLREEIDIFPGPDDSIPPGIESDDYDSEEDIPVDVPNILPTLHMDLDFIPSHNDLRSDLDVSSPFGDRNKIYDPGICIEVESTRFLATHSPVIDTLLPFSSENEDKALNHGVLASKEKSPPSLSHRGFKASKLFHHKSLMLIHGENIPILDVPFLHFYPP
ncbi:hypothetical protein Tco_1391413 [Tanacetum coccineum]